jgi:PAS domain S-box-containing protein
MRKSLLLAEHFTKSLVVLIILLCTVFLSSSLVQNILTNPHRYFNADLSETDLQLMVIYIAVVVISVLISFIIYLLLTLRTRAEIMIFNAIKPLALSLEQFKKLYEGAPVPYLILNQKGEILELNKAALRFFGAVPKEIINKNLFSCEPKEDLEKIEKLFQYYKSHIPINKEEVRMINKNGAVKWVLLSVFELSNSKSSNRTGLATIFDITEQKQLDQAKTEFVSLASHQLRTPVASVKWLVGMLLSIELGELSAKQRDYLDRIDKVNQGMIELIETLLNVSRIEIGSIKMESKPTNVIELVESVLLELSFQIEEKMINIDKQYNDSLKNIESDPKFLRIVIQNLISNAVKYTPNKGTVTIILGESLGEKTIIVSDTGFGIPANQQDKIFTKLFRADNARTLTSQGTGLGLYLIKSIVETVGGSINFVSEENKGSTFTVKF